MPEIMSEVCQWSPIPTVVLKDKTLNHAAKVLYALIVSHTRPLEGKMFCYAGVETLARECCVSAATAARAMASLVDRGVVIRVRRQAGKSALTYLADLTPITGDRCRPITDDRGSRRKTEVEAERCSPEKPARTCADSQSDVKPTKQPKAPSEAYMQFVRWFAGMRVEHPNEVPEMGGAEKCEGMYWQVFRTCKADHPFDDYARLTRGIDEMVRRGIGIPTFPGMLNKQKPGVLTVLAYAGMAKPQVQGNVDWSRDKDEPI